MNNFSSILIEPTSASNNHFWALPTFVISLKRAISRRQRICQHLDTIGLRYKLIDAVDGNALSNEEKVNILAPGVQIHPGAIGCYLSHLQVYKNIVADNISAALVLEDDAYLDPSFLSIMQHGCKSLEWDYCFLDSDDHNDRGPIYYDHDDAVLIAPEVWAYRLSAGPHTTHAYMITLRAARQRLECAFPMQRAIDLYDHLPYSINFRAIVKPKMAWVSEDSLTSFTSKRGEIPEPLNFAFLRRSPLFYRMRDLIRLKNVRRAWQVSALVRQGVLPNRGHWIPLPSGREIIVRR